MKRRYRRNIPEIPGLLSVADAAEYLGVTRARIHQLAGAIQQSLHDTSKPDNYLAMACPLASRPKEGARAYRTNWVTWETVSQYAAANRKPGPKGISFEGRLTRLFDS